MLPETDTEISQEMSIEQAIAMLAQRPHLIPNELIFKSLSRLVTREANGASVFSRTALDEYLAEHPEENFLLRIALSGYALSHGLLLIEDTHFSKSVREGREVQKANRHRSWLSRVSRAMLNLDTKEVTTLIREHQRLAGEVVALENRKLELEHKISGLNQESGLILERAQTRSETLLRETRESIERMQKDSLVHIKSIYDDKSREINNLEAKLEEMKQELEEMKQEIELKQILVSELSQNPDIVKEWAARRMPILKPGIISTEYLANGPRTITIDIESQLADFISFYQRHHIDFLPSFAADIRSIYGKNRSEMERSIKENGFDELLILPGNLSLPDLHDKMTAGYNPTWQSPNFQDGGGFAGAKSPNVDKPRIVLVHKTQNLADRPELAKTLNLPVTAFNLDHLLTLEDYLVFQRQYFEETKHHLDPLSWTWLATKSGARLVCAYWAPGHGQIRVRALDLTDRSEDLGARPSRSFF